MSKSERQRLFVTFEGPEGSGKSTQIKLLKEFLNSQDREVESFREPGGTTVSEAIRSILLDPTLEPMEPQTELLLYLSARSEIVRKKISPALQAGKVVLCDRYEDSTLAYQGYGRCDSLNLSDIKSMSFFARGHCVPNITFLLDIDPEQGLSRGGSHDRIEKESLAFHQRVREGFLDLAKKEPKRFVVIDSSLSIKKIQKIIQERVSCELG